MTFLDVLPPQSERSWQQAVLRIARVFAWKWWHDVATNARKTCASCHKPLECAYCHRPIRFPRNDPGWPDLFMVRGDTLIVAELKSDRGSTTADQRGWLDAFRRVRRIVVVVWKPGQAQQVAEILARGEEGR